MYLSVCWVIYQSIIHDISMVSMAIAHIPLYCIYIWLYMWLRHAKECNKCFTKVQNHKCARTCVQSCASRINYSVFSDVKNSNKEQTNLKQKDTYKVSRAMWMWRRSKTKSNDTILQNAKVYYYIHWTDLEIKVSHWTINLDFYYMR